jgi:membrane peptidoglycan carboxypeptidase
MGDYVERFGFGRTLSPDFRGESAGIVWDPASLNDSALASVAMGYQVAVTPLQMVAAASVIANGGELIEPRIVRALRQDGQRIAVTPRLIGRAVTAETAATITTFMEDVVKRGTARRVAIPGYSVAGKTGTSGKVVDGAYSKSEYNASFVGFVPSRAPVFTVLVVINAPHGEEYTGGAVAGPVFKRVAESALRHRGVPPSIRSTSPILVRRRGDPLPSVVAPAARTILTSLTSVDQGPSTMPDLSGLSARQALRALAPLNMVARLHGNGVVVAQQPGAGDAIESGMTSVLQLSRRPALTKDGELDP